MKPGKEAHAAVAHDPG